MTGFGVNDDVGLEVGEDFSRSEVADGTGEIIGEVGVIVVSGFSPVWLLLGLLIV